MQAYAVVPFGDVQEGARVCVVVRMFTHPGNAKALFRRGQALVSV